MRFTGTLLLISLLTACAAVRVDEDADEAAIREQSREFSAAYVEGDISGMMAIYTDAAVIFPNNSEMITGREAVREYWETPPGSHITRHVATPVEIRVEGDIAYDYGTYEVAGERNGERWGPISGKYLIVWKRAGGRWLMHLDMWNSRPRDSTR